MKNLIVKENIPLKKLTTLKLEGKVKEVFYPRTLKSFLKCIMDLEEINKRYILLGGGSNVIIFSNPDVVISTVKYNSFTLKKDKYLITDAGVKLNTLLKFCIENSFSGLEFLYGIPGTIGGGIITNAGTSTKWLSDIVKEIMILDNKNKIRWIKPKNFFEYRRFYYPEAKVVLQVKIKIEKKDPLRIKENILQYKILRKNQPKAPSAGCIFKNPKHISAGKLIEKAGLKGFKYKGAMISTKHANFIINKGGAKGEDIFHLIEIIKQTVYKKFNIKLEEEVKILK